MTPARYEEINGHKVEEFIWNGEPAVYIDNFLYHWTYEQACDYARVHNEHRSDLTDPLDQDPEY